MLFSGANPTHALRMFSSIARCFASAFTTGVPGGTCYHQSNIIINSCIACHLVIKVNWLQSMVHMIPSTHYCDIGTATLFCLSLSLTFIVNPVRGGQSSHQVLELQNPIWLFIFIFQFFYTWFITSKCTWKTYTIFNFWSRIRLTRGALVR